MMPAGGHFSAESRRCAWTPEPYTSSGSACASACHIALAIFDEVSLVTAIVGSSHFAFSEPLIELNIPWFCAHGGAKKNCNETLTLVRIERDGSVLIIIAAREIMKRLARVAIGNQA